MQVSTMPTVTLPSGETVAALGQGTWKMGEDPSHRQTEVTALRHGLDLGLSLIDTAEMYGDGGAEEVVGEAIQGRRDGVFLVTKFYPYNAGQKEVVAACERSLKRLNVDCIDLYLLHWRGQVPLSETLAGLGQLRQNGKIRYWGVSNFNLTDMEELVALPDGNTVATNQVLYNLNQRGIEWSLLPWSRKRGIPTMAYSPIEQGQGKMLTHPALARIAEKHQGTPAQIALAWLLQQKDMMVIPKTSSIQHMEENRKALEINLSDEDLREIDSAFPPPQEQAPLAVI